MRLTILAIVLIALGTAQPRADRTTFDPTKTQIALPLDTPPTIDGFFDGTEWAQANSWSITVDPNLEDTIRGGALGDNVTLPPFDSSDLSFQIFAGFDADNLYIAVRVTDDFIYDDSVEAESSNGNTWMDDSVEIFIDGDNSNLDTRDTSGTNPEVVDSGGQFVITVNNAYREAEAGNPGFGADAAWFAATTLLDTGAGYDAEFRISLETLGNPQPGDIIGFSVAVNDDDDGEGAERQVIWVGVPHTEATYGNLILGGKSYSAPKAAAAPTIDGVIGPNEYAGATEITVNPNTSVYDLGSGDDTWEPTDHGYSAWIIHDDDAVYVAVRVTDDMVINDTAEPGTEDGTTWEDDSVEIFFDADLGREPGRGTGEFEGQYVFTANGAWRDNEANNPTFGETEHWFAAASSSETGYQVEFKVNKSALFDPEDGAVMGFNIAVNDDDGSGRKAQLAWSGRAHSEFTYGTLTLSAGGNGGNGGNGDGLSIASVRVNQNQLEFSITTSDPAATHILQETSNIAAPQWTDITNATFTPGQGNAVTGTIPVPSNSPVFYRVVIR